MTDLNLKRIKYIPEGGSMKDCPVELQNNSDLKRAMRRLDSKKKAIQLYIIIVIIIIIQLKIEE
ncbi:hypothetical protein [Chryseobacterium indoltheticum]|uniref:hypothetical protein n=1 Tax=Chryseobacterium indoltheticum TaxID=254 RepID=UPI003F4926A5